jgi:predicted transcriptional regulator
MPAVRKGAVQIRFEILEFLFFAREPQPKTHVWRRATSLSYDDFQKHLQYLVDRGLIEEDKEGNCLIKSEGRSVYNELRRVLPSIL